MTKEMKRYRNLSGQSGITRYTTGPDYIEVEFSNDRIYLYNYKSTGEGNVEQMKKLADAGSGLSTFISKKIKGNYIGNY